MRKDHKYLVAMFLAACFEQGFPIACSTYYNERSSGISWSSDSLNIYCYNHTIYEHRDVILSDFTFAISQNESLKYCLQDTSTTYYHKTAFTLRSHFIY